MVKPIDYSSFKDENDPSKSVAPDRDNPQNVIRWWESKPGTELADSVFAQVAQIIQSDKMRIQQYNIHSRLYGNQMNPVNNIGYSITTINANTSPMRDRIAFNVIQSCVDTLTSRIAAKSRPKPYPLTSKGDSKMQRKAKKLDDFLTGIFYENHAYQRMPLMFRDGCVWGDGIIHVYNNHSRVQWERVMPCELLVDYLEAHPGPDAVKTLHRIKNIDRTTLQKWLPKAPKGAIEHLQGTTEFMSAASRSVSDTVTIVESWRLPSEPGAMDGVHCITIPGMTLRYEKYGKMRFPFTVFRYSPRLQGFWGQGLAEQLTPIQTELNRCLMTVQRSFHLGGSFKVLIHAGSKIVKSHIDNTLGSIITWAGDFPPQYITPPMVQPEIYQQIQTLKQMAYEQSGISELSATSQKQPGLNSGKAQREAIDIETDRFQAVGQYYEFAALDLADLSISEARDIYEDKQDLSVKVPGKRFLSTVPWDHVDMEDDEYVLQLFPISKLPSDPEGRLESVQELMQAGIISPDSGARLLDYPDLDEEQNLSNAQLDYLHQILDKIVEEGVYTAPEPFFPPPVMLKLGLEYYAVGKRDNLEPEKLEQIRTFMADVNQLMAAATPPPPPTGQPMANPTATPVSPLLPNVPGGAPAA